MRNVDPFAEKEGVGDGDDHLKIAWRYKNQSHSSTSNAASAGRSFNLNKPMSRERLLECAAEVKEWTEDDDFEGGDRYRDMCIKLAEALKQDRYSANVQVILNWNKSRCFPIISINKI